MLARMASNYVNELRRAYMLGVRYRSKLRSLPFHIRQQIESIRSGDVCVDCGANVGKISGMFADLGAVTHSFEPDPIAFERLAERASANNRIVPYRSAVGVADGCANLYFHKNRDHNAVSYSKASSLLSSKPNVSSGNVAVAVCDLSEFIKKLPPVRILKIDIEGYETELIPHLVSTECLDNVDVVYVEIHNDKWPELQEATSVMLDCVARSKYKDKIHFDWP